jgi:hypothetical protein
MIRVEAAKTRTPDWIWGGIRVEESRPPLPGGVSLDALPCASERVLEKPLRSEAPGLDPGDEATPGVEGSPEPGIASLRSQ